MQNPITPNTSDASTLEIQQRNDHTSLSNSIPEYPDRSNENEFEVEKRNEVYPDQTYNTELKEDKKKTNSKTNTDKEEDWDITKNKMNPENQEDNNEDRNEREESSSNNTNIKTTGNGDTQKSGLAETE